LQREILRNIIKRLRELKEPEIREFVRTIPKEWEVAQEACDALIEFICRRAGYLAKNIEDLVWPQGELF